MALSFSFSRFRTAVVALAAATLLIPAAVITAAADEPEPATVGPVGKQPCGDPITFGYYRMWRDVNTTKEEDLEAGNVQKLSDVPPEIDIVSAFATKPDEDPKFWQALKDEYLPALHAQGTGVVFTLWIDDFAKAPVENDQQAYAAYARQLYDTYIGDWGVDGIDIDVESTPTGEELDRAIGIITELGKLIGPQSDSGRYLIYDTNLAGDHPVFAATAELYDYVLLQAYGRNVSTIQGTWSTFAPLISSCQFLLGFSFYEENDASGGWGDTLEPFEDSRAVEYAKWQPFGGEKGGVFAYAIDRDGKAPDDDTISRTDFDWMKRLDGIARDAVGAHLPAVDRDVDLIGSLELEPGANHGRIGGLAAEGEHAYLSTAAGPTCTDTGVHVVDLTDPSAPTEVEEAFIPADRGNYIGEALQVSGDLLVHGNQTCRTPRPTAADRGGVSFWDVSDPTDPKPVAEHVGDRADVAALQLWKDEKTGRSYLATVDADGPRDLDILDVTDPAAPQLIIDNLDLGERFGVGQDDPAGLTEAAGDQLGFTRKGNRDVLIASYGDGGQVLLDVSDPRRPGLVAESDYAALDEERQARGERISPEGNAGAAAVAPNNRHLLGVDRDAVPYRNVATIDSGPHAGDDFGYLEGANTPPIRPGTVIAGPTDYVGQACAALPPGDGTALVERGVCTFQEKADHIKAAGYDAGIVFNTVEGCNALQGMSMTGTDIPYVFVGRETGLKLLGQSDLDCSNVPDTDTESHAATVGQFFDGWGYARLFRTEIGPHPGRPGTIEQTDTWAVAESQDPDLAESSGNLSAADVALDPDNSEIGYLAHNSAGLRVVRYGNRGISEIGAWIAEGGSMINAVTVLTTGSGDQYVLAADRDFGLHVFAAR